MCIFSNNNQLVNTDGGKSAGGGPCDRVTLSLRLQGTISDDEAFAVGVAVIKAYGERGADNRAIEYYLQSHV